MAKLTDNEPEREVLFTPPESAEEVQEAGGLRVGDVVQSTTPDTHRGVITAMHENGRMVVKDHLGSTLYTNRFRSTWEHVPQQEQRAEERYLSLLIRKDDTVDARDVLMAMLPPDVWHEMWEDYPKDVMQAAGLLARYMGLVEVLVREHLPPRPVNSFLALNTLADRLRQSRGKGVVQSNPTGNSG